MISKFYDMDDSVVYMPDVFRVVKLRDDVLQLWDYKGGTKELYYETKAMASEDFDFIRAYLKGAEIGRSMKGGDAVI